MGDEALVAALRRDGAAAIEAWREAHPGKAPDLSKADLSAADLKGADLKGADLSWANLGRDFTEETDLSGADLSGADLSWARLDGIHLRGANLSGANLVGANLIESDLSGTNLSGSDISLAIFSDCDVSSCVGLESVQHEWASSIGVDTLIRTLRSMGGEFSAEQRLFFIESGVPETLLLYLPSALTADPLQFYPSFLSYANEDADFTGRLYQELRAHKVKVWWFPESALGGRPVWGNIDRAIQSYEKLIVVCSEHSLTNDHVIREIERALEKEAGLLRRQKDHPTIDADVLIPLTLDGFVFDGWQHHLKADVRRKVVVDFRNIGTKKGYQAALARLMRALNPRAWPVA